MAEPSAGTYIINKVSGGARSTYDILDREYVYVDGIIDEYRIIPTTKYIKSLSTERSSKAVADPDSNIIRDISDNKSRSIIALDLETRTVNNTLEVISACWTNGVEDKSFYITDYDGPTADKQLLKSLIDSLLDNKYNGSHVYVHNLSTFDGIFLLKTIYD